MCGDVIDKLREGGTEAVGQAWDLVKQPRKENKQRGKRNSEEPKQQILTVQKLKGEKILFYQHRTLESEEKKNIVS